MQRLILVLSLVLLGGLSYGANHTITSLPYTASINNDTLTLAGTKLTSATDGLIIHAHDVVVNLGNDTLAFGAAGGDGNRGIELGYGSYNVRIIGGTVLHSGFSGSDNICLFMESTHDIQIIGTDMEIGGIDGHCITTPSIGPPGQYNIDIIGGDYTSHVSSFTSRCYYDGSVIKLTNATYKGYGSYHYNLQNLNVHGGPAQSIVVYGRTGGNAALTHISGCTLSADSRNNMYPCQPGGCETCRSNANPYQLLLCILAPGSKIYNNHLSSGTQYAGCRGILLENCLGEPNNPIEVYKNYIDVHEGPNGEDAHGSLQAFRIRSIDGGTHGYINIHDNTIMGTVDTNPGTPSIGTEMRLFYHSVQPGDAGYVIVDRNKFIAKSLDNATDCKAFVVERMPEASSVPGNEYRYNRIESSGTIVKLGDFNLASNDVILKNDTLAFRDPTTTQKATWRIGRYDGESLDNAAIDCAFENGASDTNIVWTACQNGNNQFSLEKTIRVMVTGNNGLPVPNASVTITNHYGKVVGSGFTGRSGEYSNAVKYWYEAEDTPDSTAFNDFHVAVNKNGDNTSGYVELNSQAQVFGYTLANTPGEECTDCDYICGDFNSDGISNLVDLLYLIQHIYNGGPAPFDFNAMDVTSDGVLDLLDILRFVDFHYGGGPPLVCP